MDLEKIAEKYLCSGGSVAVIGASTKKERTSFRIVEFLKERGVTVFPVNPSYMGQEIAGSSFFASINDIEEELDIVDIVVSPKFQGEIEEDLINLGYKPVVWFQPGAENPELERALSGKGFTVVSDACIMVVQDLYCPEMQ